MYTDTESKLDFPSSEQLEAFLIELRSGYGEFEIVRYGQLETA